MNEIIEKFFIEEGVGECTDNQFEFGNTHRKNITCAFCIDGICHYNGDCDRRTGETGNDGWKFN